MIIIIVVASVAEWQHSKEECVDIMQQLSGKSHKMMTYVILIMKNSTGDGTDKQEFLEETNIKFC